MTSTGAGRPRITTKRRPGENAREEILDAAAELFTTRGFTSTSTRLIAETVGMRQASLYHHFATKDDMLDALLAGTVDAPLAVADAFREATEPAVVKMYALALFDAEQLATSRWNLGALYLLPELRGERFETFRDQRHALMDEYAALAREVLGDLGADALSGAEELPFRLVETVVNARADRAAGRVSGVGGAESIAAAAVRALGWFGPLDQCDAEARELLAIVTDS